MQVLCLFCSTSSPDHHSQVLILWNSRPRKSCYGVMKWTDHLSLILRRCSLWTHACMECEVCVSQSLYNSCLDRNRVIPVIPLEIEAESSSRNVQTLLLRRRRRRTRNESKKECANFSLELFSLYRMIQTTFPLEVNERVTHLFLQRCLIRVSKVHRI